VEKGCLSTKGADKAWAFLFYPRMNNFYKVEVMMEKALFSVEISTDS
jgi:hypothetical protein